MRAHDSSAELKCTRTQHEHLENLLSLMLTQNFEPSESGTMQPMKSMSTPYLPNPSG